MIALWLTTAAMLGPCDTEAFRDAARDSYTPWYQPISGRAQLRRMKRCEQRERLRRIQIRIARSRARAIRDYRDLTPYEGLGARWSIPAYIVACESGGSWTAYNPSGAAGPYQEMPIHGRPWPIDSMRDRMEHHRIASELWQGGSGASHWVCA